MQEKQTSCNVYNVMPVMSVHELLNEGMATVQYVNKY